MSIASGSALEISARIIGDNLGDDVAQHRLITERLQPFAEERAEANPYLWNMREGSKAVPASRHSGIVLVYMATHGFILAGNRPGTAAQTPPTVNHQNTQANYSRNFTAGSYHIDTDIPS